MAARNHVQLPACKWNTPDSNDDKQTQDSIIQNPQRVEVMAKNKKRRLSGHSTKPAIEKPEIDRLIKKLQRGNTYTNPLKDKKGQVDERVGKPVLKPVPAPVPKPVAKNKNQNFGDGILDWVKKVTQKNPLPGMANYDTNQTKDSSSEQLAKDTADEASTSLVPDYGDNSDDSGSSSDKKNDGKKISALARLGPKVEDTESPGSTVKRSSEEEGEVKSTQSSSSSSDEEDDKDDKKRRGRKKKKEKKSKKKKSKYDSSPDRKSKNKRHKKKSKKKRNKSVSSSDTESSSDSEESERTKKLREFLKTSEKGKKLVKKTIEMKKKIEETERKLSQKKANKKERNRSKSRSKSKHKSSTESSSRSRSRSKDKSRSRSKSKTKKKKDKKKDVQTSGEEDYRKKNEKKISELQDRWKTRKSSAGRRSREHDRSTEELSRKHDRSTEELSRKHDRSTEELSRKHDRSTEELSRNRSKDRKKPEVVARRSGGRSRGSSERQARDSRVSDRKVIPRSMDASSRKRRHSSDKSDKHLKFPDGNSRKRQRSESSSSAESKRIQPKKAAKSSKLVDNPKFARFMKKEKKKREIKAPPEEVFIDDDPGEDKEDIVVEEIKEIRTVTEIKEDITEVKEDSRRSVHLTEVEEDSRLTAEAKAKSKFSFIFDDDDSPTRPEKKKPTIISETVEIVEEVDDIPLPEDTVPLPDEDGPAGIQIEMSNLKEKMKKRRFREEEPEKPLPEAEEPLIRTVDINKVFEATFSSYAANKGVVSSRQKYRVNENNEPVLNELYQPEVEETRTITIKRDDQEVEGEREESFKSHDYSKQDTGEVGEEDLLSRIRVPHSPDRKIDSFTRKPFDKEDLDKSDELAGDQSVEDYQSNQRDIRDEQNDHRRRDRGSVLGPYPGCYDDYRGPSPTQSQSQLKDPYWTTRPPPAHPTGNLDDLQRQTGQQNDWSSQDNSDDTWRHNRGRGGNRYSHDNRAQDSRQESRGWQHQEKYNQNNSFSGRDNSNNSYHQNDRSFQNRSFNDGNTKYNQGDGYQQNRDAYYQGDRRDFDSRSSFDRSFEGRNRGFNERSEDYYQDDSGNFTLTRRPEFSQEIRTLEEKGDGTVSTSTYTYTERRDYHSTSDRSAERHGRSRRSPDKKRKSRGGSPDTSQRSRRSLRRSRDKSRRSSQDSPNRSRHSSGRSRHSSGRSRHSSGKSSGGGEGSRETAKPFKKVGGVVKGYSPEKSDPSERDSDNWKNEKHDSSDANLQSLQNSAQNRMVYDKQHGCYITPDKDGNVVNDVPAVNFGSGGFKSSSDRSNKNRNYDRRRSDQDMNARGRGGRMDRGGDRGHRRSEGYLGGTGSSFDSSRRENLYKDDENYVEKQSDQERESQYKKFAASKFEEKFKDNSDPFVNRLINRASEEAERNEQKKKEEDLRKKLWEKEQEKKKSQQLPEKFTSSPNVKKVKKSWDRGRGTWNLNEGVQPGEEYLKCDNKNESPNFEIMKIIKDLSEDTKQMDMVRQMRVHSGRGTPSKVGNYHQVERDYNLNNINNLQTERGGVPGKEWLYLKEDIRYRSNFSKLDHQFHEYNIQQLRKKESYEIIKSYNISIQQHDILSLTGLKWVNDQCIEFYLHMISKRNSLQAAKDLGFPSLFPMNTYFFTRLNLGGYDKVKNWTKKVDIFKYDILVIPIHLLQLHWSVIIVDFRVPGVFYYDSMSGEDEDLLLCKSYLSTIINYLKEEHLAKKKTEICLKNYVKEVKDNCPEQKNGSDCGMFVLKVVEYISRDVEPDFTQDDLPYFRQRMLWEICNNKLISP